VFTEFSEKQVVLHNIEELFPNNDMYIVHGAIRTGKTLIGTRSWLLHRLEMTYNTKDEEKAKGWNRYAIVGVTRPIVYENVITDLMLFLKDLGYMERRNLLDLKVKQGKSYFINKQYGYLYIRYKGKVSVFRYFGLDKENADRYMRGSTYRSVLADEAPLISITLLSKLIGRTLTFRDRKNMFIGNPEGDSSHEFYQTYILDGYKKKYIVLHFHFLDNPMFTQQDVEDLKEKLPPNMFLQQIEGRWVLITEGPCYPKFDDSFVKSHEEIMKNNINKLNMGIDTGYTDSFHLHLSGFVRANNKVLYLDEFFHQNDPKLQKDKDIFDYLDEFEKFCKRVYEEYCKVKNIKYITVYVDSADKGFRLALERIKQERQLWYIQISRLNKKETLLQEKSNIKSRIQFENILLGYDAVEYSERVPHLIEATKKAEMKNNERLDNKKTAKFIGSLDAKEYSTLSEMNQIHEIIMQNEVIGNKFEFSNMLRRR